MHGRIKKVNFSDPFYKTCCIEDDECSGVIQIHHNFIYASKQVDEPWSALPVCEWHHSKEKRRDIGDRLDRVMLSRMKSEDKAKYPRKDWAQLERYLKTTR